MTGQQIGHRELRLWRLLLFNVTWTVSNAALHVVLGVVIALALNSEGLIGRRIYCALFVLPWAMPGYIVALTWRNMYDDRFGATNQLLGIINRYLGINRYVSGLSAGGVRPR